MSRLWQVLEQIFGTTASHTSWQLMLGEDYEVERDMLLATDRLSVSLPVSGRPYERIEVREFDDGVFEGYNEKTETWTPIDRRDIVCFNFSIAKQAKILSELVGFDENFEELDKPLHRFRLGQYGNPNGSGFPIYLAKVDSPSRLDWCID